MTKLNKNFMTFKNTPNRKVSLNLGIKVLHIFTDNDKTKIN